VGDLMYTSESGGVWTIEPADDSPDDTGLYTSLALDASNNPHISFYDQSNGDLKSAVKSGGTWTVETADPSPDDVGLDTSIALDAAGKPHISYYDASVGDLYYARKTTGTWEILPVDDSFDNAGMYTSIALDASGQPHISYQNNTTANLMHAVGPADVVSVSDHLSPRTPDLAVFPNPTHAGVLIQLSSLRAQQTSAIEIFDLRGRRERRLQLAGAASIQWDGRDENGRPVGPGIHFVRPVGSGTPQPAQRLVIVR